MNTILSNGIGASSDSNCSHAVVSHGHNIDSGSSCGLTGSGDRSTTDPKLGSLADNGGPTLTQLPALDSPALNAGLASACPATDQRGVARPQDGACDIGAVERTFAADLAVGVTLAQPIVPLIGRLTYTIKVTNAGPDAAPGVELTTVLPANSTTARGAPFSVAKGARVRFKLSRASKVRFLVQKRRRVKHKLRWVTLKGGRSERNGRAGSNSVRVSGRVRHKPLAPGRYRLSLVAHDAGGTAKAKNASFRIVRAR